MHRFRNTFTRSRTPTGAEMKTQSSLEVPKQVRSASFDEIQLEAQRANQFLKVHQSSADESTISPGLLLQVPQPGAGQRSRSFDLTGAGGEDSQAAVAAAFLDVPKRFQRRKSSSKTPPPCIHCLYLEEYRRLTGVEQRQYYDNSEYQELSYTSSSSDDEDDYDGEDGDGDPDEDQPEEDPDGDFDFNFPGCNVQCNTLLPPPLVSPCGITFTLSPTNGDDIEDGGTGGVNDPDETTILPDIGPILPPPPMFDTPPYPPLPPFPLGSLPIGSPPITPCPAYPAPSPTIEVPPCSPAAADESPGAGATRTRRRSISRQEAIFVEPTGNSLENVSSAEPTNQDINIIVPDSTDVADAESSSRNQSCESVDIDQNEFSDNQYHQYHLPRPSLPAAVAADFVRDIYLQVPDLKRDRAASVDSCFTKVTGAKTEELKPPEGELTLLAVPSSGAIRSRSVDIVLPTEEQARYKALALAGTAGTAAGAVGVGAKG